MILSLVLVCGFGFWYVNSNKKTEESILPNSDINNTKTTEIKPKTLAWPLERAGERITKKLFGTYVNPKNSPVSPEKFTGFHTGLDFETFPEEKDIEVVVKAICVGELLQKRIASGYGGVMVQKCVVNDQKVTVVYGHLKLSSILKKVGEEFEVGENIGVLGKGGSAETDGERKHLHLSIYTGNDINIKGYVKTKPELSLWLDPEILLSK
jgi:hypothetical protein